MKFFLLFGRSHDEVMKPFWAGRRSVLGTPSFESGPLPVSSVVCKDVHHESSRF